MENDYLVSVIIPVHNTANYLRKCVDSVRNQSLKSIEIILVENLSICLLYTSDAADDLLCVDLGGRRIIKKKKCVANRSVMRM